MVSGRGVDPIVVALEAGALLDRVLKFIVIDNLTYTTLSAPGNSESKTGSPESIPKLPWQRVLASGSSGPLLEIKMLTGLQIQSFSKSFSK